MPRLFFFSQQHNGVREQAEYFAERPSITSWQAEYFPQAEYFSVPYSAQAEYFWEAEYLMSTRFRDCPSISERPSILSVQVAHGSRTGRVFWEAEYLRCSGSTRFCVLPEYFERPSIYGVQVLYTLLFPLFSVLPYTVRTRTVRLIFNILIILDAVMAR